MEAIGPIAECVKLLRSSGGLGFRGKSELEAAGQPAREERREREDLSNRESPVCAFVETGRTAVSVKRLTMMDDCA